MQVLTCVSTGKSVSLTKLLASSGEGEVWETSVKGYLAKRYHNTTSERVNKLKVMLAYPPVDPNSQINHVSFAWPKSLLKDNSGKCVGFLMPAIRGSVDLIHIYNPAVRKKKKLAINWLFLHTAARNIASLIEAIHDNGYVVGDIKPQNILVNDRALPSIIDTDSFQVTNPATGEVFRCLVGSEGYTPVELLKKDLATVDQTEVHDRFRLAVIIYQLLFGDHPFKGQWTGEGDSPEPTKLIEKGFWPYAQNSKIQPGRLTISLDVVHPEIKRCFLQCFNDGHTRPHLRPTAQEWRSVFAFVLAERNLIECTKVEGHYYSKSYGNCNWCERKANLAIDIFENARFTVKVKQTLNTGTKPLAQTPGVTPFPGNGPKNTSYTLQRLYKISREVHPPTPSPIPPQSQQNLNPPPQPPPLRQQLSHSQRKWLVRSAVIGIGVFAGSLFLNQSPSPENKPASLAPSPRNLSTSRTNLSLAPRKSSPAPRKSSPAPRKSSPAPRKSSPVPRKSSPAVSYSRLRTLLKAGQWKEADEETISVMLKVAGMEEQGFFDEYSLRKFPKDALRKIDQLWLKYSNNRFGFSVQKKIWLEAGGRLDVGMGLNSKYATYINLADAVGWREGGSWLLYDNFTFNTNAPIGHLPSVLWVGRVVENDRYLLGGSYVGGEVDITISVYSLI